jgi:hypothetical protein
MRFPKFEPYTPVIPGRGRKAESPESTLRDAHFVRSSA